MAQAQVENWVQALPTISEEEGSGGARPKLAEWEMSRDRNVISRYRAGAKGNHTKYALKIEEELSRPVQNVELIKVMRAELVRLYEEMEIRHQRLLLFTPPEEKADEEEWIKAADRAHAVILARLDSFPTKVHPCPAPSRAGSQHSSHKSITSTLSKLREAELELKASQLQMEQEEEEERIAKQEQQHLDAIEAARKRRQREYELAQKLLRTSTLQAQAADLMQEEEGPFRGWPDEASGGQQPQQHISTSRPSTHIDTPFRPDPAVSGQDLRLRPAPQSFWSTSARQLRSLGSRVVNAMTPQRNTIVDGYLPSSSSYNTSSAIINNRPAVSGAPPVSGKSGSALLGAPPLSTTKPVMTTAPSTVIKSSLNHNAPPFTSSALFGAPLVSGGPAAAFDPFAKASGPALYGALPTSVTTTTPYKIPQPIQAGQALLGAPPVSNHFPNYVVQPPSSSGPARYAAPPSSGTVLYAAPLESTPLPFTYNLHPPFSSGHVRSVAPPVTNPRRVSWSTPSPTNPFLVEEPEQATDYFVPDEWIFQLDPDAPAVRNGLRPPKLELPYFDGNPLAYPMFIQSFKVQIHEACSSDAERQRHLKNCLSKDIQLRLGEALLNPALYRHALTELYRKYGHPRIISTACSTALLSLQSFRDNDFKALSKFSSTLHSVVATLRLGGYGNELQSSSTLSQLVHRLPPGLRSRWAEKSYQINDRLPHIGDLDAWLDDVTTAEYCVRAGAAVQTYEPESAPSSKPNQRDRKEKEKQNHKTFANDSTPPASTSSSSAAPSSSSSSLCANCSGPSHHIRDCKRFRDLDVGKRAAVVVEKTLCYRCLEQGHRSRECEKKENCGEDGCKGMHHKLLHGAPRMYPDSRDSRRSAPKSESKKEDSKKKSSGKVKWKEGSPESRTFFADEFTAATSTEEIDISLLPIVPVVVSAGGCLHHTLALIDSCSTCSMVVENLAARLKISGPAHMSKIGTWHGQDPAILTQRVDFQIGHQDGSSIFDLNRVRTVSSLNLNYRKTELRKLVKQWPHLSGITLPSCSSLSVEILIGQDHPEAQEMFEMRKDPYGRRAPRALLTAFGWTIVGPATSPKEEEQYCLRTGPSVEEDSASELSRIIDNLILTDDLVSNAKPPVPAEETRAKSILETTTKFIGDRFESGLLWKYDDIKMPDNRAAVLNRFHHTQRRLRADPALGEIYTKTLNGYISLGHARRLSQEEVERLPKGRTWFLPHHPVLIKPGKPRIVFDAAAKYGGVSLNSLLLKGPLDQLGSLIGVLLRFREHRIALSSDIVKMFHQVRVAAADQAFFCFWWSPPTSKEPPSIHQMNVQIFGAICSPAICSYVLRRAAEAGGEDAQAVGQQILDHFYVDNWLTSFDTEEEAINMAKTVSQVLKKSGFELAEWGSTSRNVMLALPGTPVNEIQLDLEGLPTEKALGMKFNYQTDSFMPTANVPVHGKTKRELFRARSSVYDPFGMLAAVIVPAKILVQSICQKNCSWDEELDPELLVQWKEWATSLAHINGLAIPRCFNKEDGTVEAYELHMFSDASERAYGAVGYLRLIYTEGHYGSAFVMAKSRLAKAAYMSIHRLELNGALESIRLAILIKKELRLPIRSTTFWTDSVTVLRWINSTTCQFHIYVGNRVGEILESSDPAQWMYVPTALNPADDLSRGVPADTLHPGHRLYTGPEYLCKEEGEMPSQEFLKKVAAVADDPEIRSLNWIGATVVEESQIEKLIESFLPFTKKKRILAEVIRAGRNFRRKKGNRIIGELTAEEIRGATDAFVLRAQELVYGKELAALRRGAEIEKSSSLLKLSPFIDRRGLLCVGGRIDKAPVLYDTRHPVILPSDSKITKLIIIEIHGRLQHATADRVLADFRKLYYAPRARFIIRCIVSRCYTCRRNSARPVTPKMAELPWFRLQPHLPPFTHTGVDLFGPIEVKILRRSVKRWGVLFTCLCSRAVHLEMAYTLETDSFLCALDRFRHSRGAPAALYSDNGTNFVGADRELREGFARLDQSHIHNQLANKGIKWSFNTPSAPHHGGAWERLVRSAKRALRFVLHKQTLTDEVLTTALKLAESLLNSRPLTYISTDADDPEPLTPNHLLLGRANAYTPPDIIGAEDLSSRKRWRVAQAIAHQFWRRWMREVLPTLLQRSKWLQPQRNLQEKDVVILIRKDNHPGIWPLGIIEKVFPDPDNVVRSVLVRTGGTVLKRPVVDLCLLEPESSQD